jgi:hypothetical protein
MKGRDCQGESQICTLWNENDHAVVTLVIYNYLSTLFIIRNRLEFIPCLPECPVVTLFLSCKMWFATHAEIYK